MLITEAASMMMMDDDGVETKNRNLANLAGQRARAYVLPTTTYVPTEPFN